MRIFSKHFTDFIDFTSDIEYIYFIFSKALFKSLLEEEVPKNGMVGVVVVESNNINHSFLPNNSPSNSNVVDQSQKKQTDTDTQTSKHTNNQAVVYTQKEKLHNIGTAAMVVELVKSDWLNEKALVLLRGVCRFKVSASLMDGRCGSWMRSE